MSPWKIGFTPSGKIIDDSSASGHSLGLLLALLTLALIVSTLYLKGAIEGLILTNIDGLFKSRSKPESFSLPGFYTASSKLAALLDKALNSDAKAPETPVLKPTAQPKPAESIEAIAAERPANPAVGEISDVIFRAYDIRGRANEQLTDEVVYQIALAIGSEALDQGHQRVVVAADGRHSSPRILAAMSKGLLASGCDVVDISMQPTPLMYFATHEYATQTGVMITGSHNPVEGNGIKVVIGGAALSGDAIKNLHKRIINGNLHSGQGQYESSDIEQAYIDYIINGVAIAQPLKIVIDAGNGVTGMIAPRLFRELGCEVIELYCDIDGDFPNHHPDPSVEANLEDLKRVVIEQRADIGIAFDGDGDRLGVVTASGKSVAADRLLMLFAQDVVSRNPGADVIFDVKCTRSLNSLISNYGGRPIMWKSGHSFMKEKMMETGALLGGEFSGHIFFKERWFGFDDGMYAAARLIEILSTTDPDLDIQLEAFPEFISSPELKIVTGEDQKFIIIEKLLSEGQFGDGKLATLDGLRVDFADGWGLVRASNTTPMLTLRFEADDEAAMQRIQQQFKQQLSAVDPDLEFTF
jgi:phosphomannomutase/phosphoglucomutase